MSYSSRSLLLALAMLALGLVLGAVAVGGTSSVAVAAPERIKPAPAHYSRYRKLDMLARSLAIIEQYYVRPVDDEELVYAAIRGLVGELDPHTSFLPPRDAQLLREDIEGVFGGVGMVVALGRDDDGARFLEIRDVVPDGPAYAAGIEVGQRIVKIDNQAIAHFADLQRAILYIRGEPGTSVRVTIDDPVKQILKTVTLTRAVIDPPAVEVRYLGEGLGLLRLREFSELAAKELRQGIEQLEARAGKAGLQGVVVDLRDNGGGLLDEAVAIVDLFVKDGAIVRTRGRRGLVLDEARAHRTGTIDDLAVVVLVNKASASASEIVAGALQDHHRALVVGERTYGKGSVQSPFELSDGSLLKLTTALYYTPADRLIQASGIVPDVYVGAAPPGSTPNLDSRPELQPERATPRHLRPEDFGVPTPTAVDETPALRSAGDDLQLRESINQLKAWRAVRG